MAVDDEFGVFNNILNLDGTTSNDDDDNIPINYNVYQVKSQTPTMSDQDIQRLYGTDAFPVFQWAKKIKTGERTYKPGDEYDEDMMEKYRKIGNLPPGFLSAQEIIAQQALQGTAGQIGTMVGSSIGAEISNPYATGDMLDKIGSGIMKTGRDTTLEQINNARFGNLPEKSQNLIKSFGLEDNYIRELSSEKLAKATGNLAQFERGKATGTLLETSKGSGTFVPTDDFGKARNFAYGDETSGFPEGFDPTLDSKDGLAPLNTVTEASTLGTVTDRLNPFTDAGSANVTSSGVGAGLNFVSRVASGQDIDDAAKSAADAGLVQYATTALLAATPLAPFSTIIGGVVGGFVGRVICNELMRQGIMDRKQVVLDYKFTRDYLTPTHVSGYHVWAVWMVKQMRKGRLVGLWSHIAGHSAKEIAYIYGERDKPDYLGKLYRKILEPICWTIGTFCKETDWSILYRKKEV